MLDEGLQEIVELFCWFECDELFTSAVELMYRVMGGWINDELEPEQDDTLGTVDADVLARLFTCHRFKSF